MLEKIKEMENEKMTLKILNDKQTDKQLWALEINEKWAFDTRAELEQYLMVLLNYKDLFGDYHQKLEELKK